MEQEEKKPRYKWLAVMVGIVAAVSGGFYLYQFGSNGLSSKSEDWANFATYISGTVGVAAVVATLMAFVITLMQQHKLVKSQDGMLQKQEEHLRQARKQLEWAQQSTNMDQAYKNIKDIFPLMLEEFKKSLLSDVVDDVFAPVVNSAYNLDSVQVFSVYERPSVLVKYFTSSSGYKGEYEYGMRLLFGNIILISRFANDNVSVSKELYYLVDIMLSRDFGFGKNGWFYVEAYNMYCQGLGVKPIFVKEKSLERQSVTYNDIFPVLARWYDVGNILKEKNTEI